MSLLVEKHVLRDEAFFQSILYEALGLGGMMKGFYPDLKKLIYDTRDEFLRSFPMH